jgi:hypothetical protein
MVAEMLTPISKAQPWVSCRTASRPTSPRDFCFDLGQLVTRPRPSFATEAGLGGREFVRPRLPSRGRLTRVVATSADFDDKSAAHG